MKETPLVANVSRYLMVLLDPSALEIPQFLWLFSMQGFNRLPLYTSVKLRVFVLLTLSFKGFK